MFCLLINLISMSNEFIGSTESILDNGNAEGKEGGGVGVGRGRQELQRY